MTDNAEQRLFWSEIAGSKWVTNRDAMDATLQPVLDLVLTRAALDSGLQVVDIGCGTGASVLAAADHVGPAGHVTGADISPTLLADARARAAGRSNITLIEADAAAHGFDGDADRLISRFGVMFFADPVGAFVNMRRALKPGGLVCFASWGQIPNNPYFIGPAGAVRAVLGAPPKTDPDAPGPFAFRDPDRVRAILADAGYADIAVDVETLHLTPRGDASDMADSAMEIGPAQPALAHFEATDVHRAELRAALVDVFAGYQTGDGLRIPAEINLVTARAPT